MSSTTFSDTVSASRRTARAAMAVTNLNKFTRIRLTLSLSVQSSKLSDAVQPGSVRERVLSRFTSSVSSLSSRPMLMMLLMPCEGVALSFQRIKIT